LLTFAIFTLNTYQTTGNRIESRKPPNRQL